MSSKTVTVQTEAGSVEIPESQADNNIQASHDALLDATEQPVSTPEPSKASDAVETPEPVQSEREAKLEAIAARRLQEIASTNKTPDPVAPDESEELDEKPASKRHKIKVDGEEIELSFDEMRVLAQKGKAADKRFEEASKLTKTSEQRIKELEEKLAQFDSATLPAKDGTKKQDLPKDGPLVFTADSIDKAVYAGDEEGARLREEMAKRLSANVDPTEIKNQVRKEMRIEAAIESVSNADPIARQLLNDSRMVQIVDQYSEMLLRLEPSLSEAENIAKACKQAHMHFPELVMPEQPPAMTPAKQKTATKQAHAAGNVSAPAQRTTIAPEPLTAAQAQAQAKAELKRLRGLV